MSRPGSNEGVEIVEALGIVREPGFVYFLRDDDVCRRPVNGNAEPEVIARLAAPADRSHHLYFLTEDGHVARVPATAGQSALARNAEQREAVYAELWGKPEVVWHELALAEPHIDVYVYPPDHDRDWYTLVTCGMSDRPLRAEPPAPRRVEMVMYVREPQESHQDLMHALAHHAHDAGRSLRFGLTLPNGDPPQPYFEDSELSVLLLTRSILRADAELPERLGIDGDPVELLWILPITARECELKLRQGSIELLRRFYDARMSPALDERRKSLV